MFADIQIDEHGFFTGFEGLTQDGIQTALRITDVYISADFNPRPGKSVWIDTYGGTGKDRQTVYGHIHPDEAEAIGMALITAAKVARGELKYEDLKEK